MYGEMITILAAVLISGFGIYGVAPELFGEVGFPLDDAWIHSVYARSLATSLTFAYNPGVPAAGATSLLWPILLAPVQALSQSTEAYVLGVRFLGFVLHWGAAVVVFWVISRPVEEDRCSGTRRRLEGVAASLILGLHPDLMAAALSGMEVALSEFVLALVLLAAITGKRMLLFFVALFAFLSRPEMAVLTLLIPALVRISSGLKRMFSMVAPAALGLGFSVALMAVRNIASTGRPLPSTFYAKVGESSFSFWESMWMGFDGLLGRIYVLQHGPVLLVILVLSVAGIFVSVRNQTRVPVGYVAIVSGFVFVGVSVILIPPFDPNAFYHQRYVLPGVAAILIGIPEVVAGAARLVPNPLANFGMLLVAVLVALEYGTGFSGRFQRLVNDSRNIDDVQVAIGRALGKLGQDIVVWTVDAGAVRYFSEGEVIDLMGLNTPQILSDQRLRFLHRKQPTHIVLMSPVGVLREASIPLEAWVFSVSTTYTVTSYPQMATQYLVVCRSGVSGAIVVHGVPMPFMCKPENTH